MTPRRWTRLARPGRRAPSTVTAPAVRRDRRSRCLPGGREQRHGDQHRDGQRRRGRRARPPPTSSAAATAATTCARGPGSTRSRRAGQRQARRRDQNDLLDAGTEADVLSGGPASDLATKTGSDRGAEDHDQEHRQRRLAVDGNANYVRSDVERVNGAAAKDSLTGNGRKTSSPEAGAPTRCARAMALTGFSAAMLMNSLDGGSAPTICVARPALAIARSIPCAWSGSASTSTMLPTTASRRGRERALRRRGSDRRWGKRLPVGDAYSNRFLGGLGTDHLHGGDGPDDLQGQGARLPPGRLRRRRPLRRRGTDGSSAVMATNDAPGAEPTPRTPSTEGAGSTRLLRHVPRRHRHRRQNAPTTAIPPARTARRRRRDVTGGPGAEILHGNSM